VIGANLNAFSSFPKSNFFINRLKLRIFLGEGNEEFVVLLFSRLNLEKICYVGLRDLDQPET